MAGVFRADIALGVLAFFEMMTRRRSTRRHSLLGYEGECVLKQFVPILRHHIEG